MNDDQNALLAKIAALEAEIAPLRKQRETIRNAIIRNPAGALSELGVPPEHVTGVMVGTTLGAKAPLDLQILAQQGPLMAQLATLTDSFEALRQRTEAAEARVRLGDTRIALQKLAADKTKYPHMATALAADNTLFDGDLNSFRGSADEFAKVTEDRLARSAKALGMKTPPASQVDADNATSATSTQAKGASTGIVAGDPPPIPQKQTGSGFSEADQKALRDEIVRNADRGVYSVPATAPPH